MSSNSKCVLQIGNHNTLGWLAKFPAAVELSIPENLRAIHNRELDSWG